MLVTVWGGVAAAAPPDGRTRELPAAVEPRTRAALEALEASEGPVRARYDRRRGTARSLRGKLGRLGPSGAARDEAAFKGWVAAHEALLGLDDGAMRDGAVRLTALVTDRHGHAHASFARLHRGLPVWGSDFTVHADPRGVVTAVTGRFEGRLQLEVAARVAGPDARERARRHPWSRAAETRAEAAELGVLSTEGGPRLAWRVEVDGAPDEAWAVWVDADTGEILDSEPLVMDAVTPAFADGVTGAGKKVPLEAAWSEAHGGFILSSWPLALGGRRHDTLDAGGHDKFDPVASFAVPFVSPDGVFDDTAAVDAHRHVRQVLDWLHDTHGWRSWDGQGAAMTALVHFGEQLSNAFWHGKLKAMMFGDGDGQVMTSLAGCLDIAAHELTHAVIQATVNLAYKGQAGALNEHVADAFSTFLDPPTGAADDWFLGEDCMGPRAGRKFLRHMKRPWLGGQPAHLFEYVELPETKEGDYGGVHVNSGIPNRALALMVDELGAPNVARLYFQMLSGRYLPSTADFGDFRDGLLAACDAVWGGDAWACNRVLASIERVGLYAAGETPPCPAGSVKDALRGCYCSKGTLFDEAAWACTDDPGEACGGVPAMGECRARSVVACEGGQVVETECDAAEEACLYAPDVQAHVCEPVAAACAQAPQGRCDGETLGRCEGGQWVSVDCAAEGRTCEESAAGAACVAPVGCVRDCRDRVCGDDGCGGTCGQCPAGDTCGPAAQCVDAGGGEGGDDDGCAGGAASGAWAAVMALGWALSRRRRRRLSDPASSRP